MAASPADYLYANPSERLASLTSGIRTWYGTDNQGSVRQMLSDTGSVLSTQNYDPYGTPEGATHPATFGYTGELQDSTTNAQYLRARWYQPGSGTLLGVDPMLDSTGQAYSYAGDNPVNASDPSGNCWYVSGKNLWVYNQIGEPLQCSANDLTEITRGGDAGPPTAIVQLPTNVAPALADLGEYINVSDAMAAYLGTEMGGRVIGGVVGEIAGYVTIAGAGAIAATDVAAGEAVADLGFLGDILAPEIMLPITAIITLGVYLAGQSYKACPNLAQALPVPTPTAKSLPQAPPATTATPTATDNQDDRYPYRVRFQIQGTDIVNLSLANVSKAVGFSVKEDKSYPSSTTLLDCGTLRYEKRHCTESEP